MGGFRLRDLPWTGRLGLTGVVLSLLVGLAASIAHLRHHHENRDAAAGVSLDDLKAAYHGIDSRAPLRVALERGHPEELDAESHDLLTRWLDGGRLSEEFDDPDLGDAAPAEVLARSCLDCHARRATEGGDIGQTMPLEYWDDVEKVSFSREVPAVPVEILVVSTHTHALSLAVVALAAFGLLLLTRFPGWIRNGGLFLGGVALFLDLAAWWLARWNDAFVLLVAGAGAVFAGSTALACVLVLLDLWLPARSRSA